MSYDTATITSSASQTLGDRYDAAGNRTSVTYPDSKAVVALYDAANAHVASAWVASRMVWYTRARNLRL